MAVERTMMPIRRFTLAVLVLIGLSGCGWGLLEGYAPLTVFDNFHPVEPGRAYRSAQLDADTLRFVLDAYAIRTVINLRGENPAEPWYQREQAVCEEAGVELVSIGMSASSLPSRDTLLQLYDTFVTAEHPLLIHCRGGADRTGAAAALWRMTFNGDDRQAAAEELSPCYGHFPGVNPEMDELIRIFQPDRTWIETQYPAP